MNPKKSRKACLACKKETKKPQDKYCNLGCFHEHRYQEYIKRWKAGLEDGNRGAEGISYHVRRYMLEKWHNQCWQCGWSERHPVTGNYPLNLNHVDGNSRNTVEENLEVICPNCHSLTANFGNLNRGKGRAARRHRRMRP